MTPEETAELVKRLRGIPFSEDSKFIERAANLIESLQASVANAEARYEACEARNEFLTGIIEAIEQAAKEAKELPK